MSFLLLFIDLFTLSIANVILVLHDANHLTATDLKNLQVLGRRNSNNRCFVVSSLIILNDREENGKIIFTHRQKVE